MTSYGKVFLEAFGLDETDFIPCSICQKQSVDFHHIISRSRFREGLNMIENVLPVCRKCHQDFGEVNDYIPMLLKIQKKTLEINKIPFNKRFFNHFINKYSK